MQAQIHALVHDANRRARAATARLRALDRSTRDKALTALAEALIRRSAELLAANRADLNGRHTHPGDGWLELTERRLEELAQGLHMLAASADPLGEVLRGSRQRSGVQLRQIRVPIGVVAVVFEEVPALLIRAVGLLLKTGNALLVHDRQPVVPRTEAMLVDIAREAFDTHGVPADAVQLLCGDGRAMLRHLLGSRGEVDLLVPMLAKGVPPQLLAEAAVPIAEIGPGNCHIYVDATADLALATRLVLDSKIDYPGLSHSAEKVLVHAEVAEEFLPALGATLRERGVALHGDERAATLLPGGAAATDADWRTEYRSLRLACAVVDSLDDALAHLGRYGTGHTETVVTTDPAVAQAFTARVDAATVTVNAPTTFGHAAANPMDPELAFCTHRLRPRGPLKLSEFTTTKWVAWPAAQEFSPLTGADELASDPEPTTAPDHAKARKPAAVPGHAAAPEPAVPPEPAAAAGRAATIPRPRRRHEADVARR